MYLCPACRPLTSDLGFSFLGAINCYQLRLAATTGIRKARAAPPRVPVSTPPMPSGFFFTKCFLVCFGVLWCVLLSHPAIFAHLSHLHSSSAFGFRPSDFSHPD